MKREILCVPCAQRTERAIPAGEPYPGEHVRYVRGVVKLAARRPTIIVAGESMREVQLRSCICDECCTPLPVGSRAVAVTMSKGSAPEWEDEYLELEKEAARG